MPGKPNTFVKKWIPIFAFAANSICLAYTLATRYTSIMVAPMPEKIAFLSGMLIIAIFISALVFLVWFRPIITSITTKTLIIISAVSFILIGILFAAVYQPPPFPEHHALTVRTYGEKNKNASGTRIAINSVSIINYPDKTQRRIPVRQFEYDGEWRGTEGNEFMVSISGAYEAAFGIRRFMQAGVEIEFQRGPDGGIVSVFWDGDESIIDLYSETDGVYVLSLDPGFNWRTADRVRKVLVAGAMMADYFAASTFAVVLAGTGIFFFSQRAGLRARKLILLSGSITVIVILLFIVLQLNTPVPFNNAGIEAGVRAALNLPEGNIYRRQLRTIISLDLSDSNITSLEGIEQLSNLQELDLQNNQVAGLAALSSLTKLQTLNLRNNNVVDLSPLAALTDLEYLNIYGNTAIQSLSPLASLNRLQKLIMSQVPIGDPQFDFSVLPKLKYLNLRGCGVKNLDFAANLPDLEYLNLHSNPEISSIQPLAELKNLETLILANIPLGEKAQAISGLRRLRYLNLRNTGLSDIDFLSGLSTLEYLNLHSNSEITSIASIRDLTNLEHLILRDIPIQEESIFLSGLDHLRTLNIRNTGISDVNFLSPLLSRGALQDNAKQGFSASLDIRDNPISSASGDAYAGIRPFWQNITFAEPGALPFYAELAPPQFSHASGFYNQPFTLAISAVEAGTDIYYTLDGSVPTVNAKKYTAPIQIKDRTDSANILSGFETIAEDWHKPDKNVQKAAIIRAIAIDAENNAVSPIITHTYFIGSNMADRYSLPVVSLVSHSHNLFAPDDGIYVRGDAYEQISGEDITLDEKQKFANFNQHGEEWERPVHIEIFNDRGTSAFSQNGGVRIHGSGSRRSAQKSLRIYSDCQYDFACFFSTANIFESRNSQGGTPDYETILLRNNGQDWMIGMMRDAVSQELFKDSLLDTQAERDVIVFLNGEYWGIYQLQERYDAYYFQNNYGIDKEDVAILRQNGGLIHGRDADAQRYDALFNFISTHDLSIPENYDHVNTQMDIDSFIDYLIANIYLGNTDWPNNNIYMWRKSLEVNDTSAEHGHDGRWRWMIFDLDFSLGLQGYGTGYTHNTLQHAQMEDWSGEFFRSLLENDYFRTAFVNKFADQMNTTFSPQRIIEHIDAHQALLAPEMDEFFARWGSNNEGLLEKWYAEVEIMRDFARKRPAYMQEHLMQEFGLSGVSNLSFNIDIEKGYIKINSLHLDSISSWEGTYFEDIPVTITAAARPGYHFSHWIGIDSEQAELTITLNTDLHLEPVFVSN